MELWNDSTITFLDCCIARIPPTRTPHDSNAERALRHERDFIEQPHNYSNETLDVVRFAFPLSRTPTVTNRNTPIVSTFSVLVRDTPQGAALYATRDLARGERILTISGRVQKQPTRYSIQIDAGRHVEADGDLPDEEMRLRHPWRFLNHSCDPVARIEGDALYARNAIRAGEEITFDYTTTEADMAEPFQCRCGSPRCVGQVQGFMHLAPREQQARRTHLAPHILRILDSLTKSTVEQPAGGVPSRV